MINTCGYGAFWITLGTYFAPTVNVHTGARGRGGTSVLQLGSKALIWFFLTLSKLNKNAYKALLSFSNTLSPVGIMHWVPLNWVLKYSHIALLAEQQGLVESVCIYCEHYDFNNVWKIHILDNNAPYQKSYLGFECVGTKEKEKAKGQIVSWCKLLVCTTWKCQPELWTAWPQILSLLTFSLTVSCAVLLVVEPPGWLHLGLVKWQVCMQKKKGRKPAPPWLYKDIFGDFVLWFKCENGLGPFRFCFSDHH